MAEMNPPGEAGKALAENLRRIRTERRLTYSAISRALDEVRRPIATLGLSRIENNERRVDVDDLLALAKVLQVDVSQLLSLPTEMGAITLKTATNEQLADELLYRLNQPLRPKTQGDYDIYREASAQRQHLSREIQESDQNEPSDWGA